MTLVRREFVAALAALGAAPVSPAARVELRTGEGAILLDLAADRAPITVANFLRYVDDKRFDGARFYRALRISVSPLGGLVQGGLENDPARILSPIAHESTLASGILHKDGVISMARYAPGTAASEFFICIGDQPSLDADPSGHGDNLGFAAFGRVAGGMDVVRAILGAQVSTTLGEGVMRGEMLDPPIAIVTVRRAGG